MKKEDIENDYEFKYQKFNPRKGFPFGPNLFYECLICNELLNSKANHCVACSCENIVVDTDAGRVNIENSDKVKLVKLMPKSSNASKIT